MQTTRNEVRQQMTTKPRRAEDESHGKSLLRPYCRHIRRHGRHEHYRGASIVTVGFDIARIDRAVGALRSMRRLPSSVRACSILATCRRPDGV